MNPKAVFGISKFKKGDNNRIDILFFKFLTNYNMLLILFTKNLLLLFNNIYKLSKIIKKKAIKDIFLFILFYLFLNLYLLPSFALCEIDLNLLDRENNIYKGSKIVHETPTQIITEEDLDYARGVCDTIVKICAVSFVITFSLYIYLLSTGK